MPRPFKARRLKVYACARSDRRPVDVLAVSQRAFDVTRRIGNRIRQRNAQFVLLEFVCAAGFRKNRRPVAGQVPQFRRFLQVRPYTHVRKR